jgi:hypothetical protein
LEDSFFIKIINNSIITYGRRNIIISFFDGWNFGGFLIVKFVFSFCCDGVYIGCYLVWDVVIELEVDYFMIFLYDLK